MPEKVLIFDFDGVLADTLDDILRFGKIVSNKLGFPVTPTGDDLNDLNQMGFAEFGRQLGLPEDKLEKVQRAMRELEATTGDTFIIGDAVSDIRTAKEASVYSIAVGWGHQRPEKLLAEKPDYFAETPQDLLAILIG